MITAGRVVVDLYPRERGVRLPEVRTFSKSLGGSPTNVAVQAARLGSRTAIFTKVGADPFGDFARAALSGFGVDTRWVGTDQAARTSLAFCEIHPPDHFPLFFYGDRHPPDLSLEEADVDPAAASRAAVLWTTGTGLSAEPSRGAHLRVLARRAACHSRGPKPTTIHDIDFRPSLWGEIGEALAATEEALESLTGIVGNLEEIALLTGTTEPADASRILVDRGLELVVVKLGRDGVLARAGDRLIEVPPITVQVANGLGAGDAFGGALAHALAHRWDIDQALKLANAAGALAASRFACADDYGTLTEITDLLSSSGPNSCIRHSSPDNYGLDGRPRAAVGDSP